MNLEQIESNVVYYGKVFPHKFDIAENATLKTVDGKEFIDFFSGAGTMNFGHNNPFIKERIMHYLSRNTIIHGLDMQTQAREDFLVTFFEKVLKPRNYNYKIMSCGPTGTNAVEAALKIARKVKKRHNILAFSGAFHGMTLGSLALTSNRASRGGAGVPLNNVIRAPYYNDFENCEASLNSIRKLLNDDHSGVDKPAAIILETIQAEGGIYVAPVEWLRGISNICKEYDILMIVDDIQVGVGRAGSFFSFERAEIVPDIVILSKSISGFGTPLSLLLLKPEIDIFSPGEHNGTFRGNQLGFVGGKAAIDFYNENKLSKEVKRKEEIISEFLRKNITKKYSEIEIRGLGMIWGIDFSSYGSKMTKQIQESCFEKGLIIELAGREDIVIKLLPPLTVPVNQLNAGLSILAETICNILTKNRIS